MTRINVVPPAELTDQHLLAEIRELPRIFTLARKRLEKHGKLDLGDIPNEYCLGAGHVKFFFLHLGWLHGRYSDLFFESARRDFDCKYISELWHGTYNDEMRDYVPTHKALILNRNRLRERINAKPYFSFSSGVGSP